MQVASGLGDTLMRIRAGRSPLKASLLVHDAGHEIALPSLLEFFDKQLAQGGGAAN